VNSRAGILVFCAILLASTALAEMEDILATPEIAEPLAGTMAEDVAAPAGETLFQKQKRLLYLFARLKRPRAARPLAARILRQAPSDKESLLVLCSMELERKNAAGVFRYARQFLRSYPDDSQGWYFVAAAESLLGHHARAQGILEKMREKFFQAKEFPYQVDLASSALLSGDWRTALAVYKELLAGRQIAPALREEARRILDGIYLEHLPRLSISSDYQHLFSAGEILRTDAAWESPLTNRVNLLANLHRDDLRQNPVGVSRAMSASRMEGTVGLDAQVARSWHLRGEAGGSSAGFLASAELRRKISATRAWYVGAGYNQRATDSLALEILDGRQSRAYAGFDWTLDDESDWRVSATSFGRVATVGRSILGSGWGAEWQVERVLLRDPVSVRISYVGQYSRFNTTATDPAIVRPLFDPGSTPAQDALALEDQGILAGTPETLIDPEISYQGLTISARRDILPQWTIEATGIFGYYLDSSQTSYGGYLRNSWRPRKSIELQANAGYMSSGTQSNTGSQVFELSLALQILF